MHGKIWRLSNTQWKAGIDSWRRSSLPKPTNSFLNPGDFQKSNLSNPKALDLWIVFHKFNNHWCAPRGIRTSSFVMYSLLKFFASFWVHGADSTAETCATALCIRIAHHCIARCPWSKTSSRVGLKAVTCHVSYRLCHQFYDNVI